MQGCVGPAHRQNLPPHGDVQRHSQKWTKVRIMPSAWTALQQSAQICHTSALQMHRLQLCFFYIVTVKSILFLPRFSQHDMSRSNTPHCPVSSGTSTSLERKRGWNTGPVQRNVKLMLSGRPVTASSRWSSSTCTLDVRLMSNRLKHWC